MGRGFPGLRSTTLFYEVRGRLGRTLSFVGTRVGGVRGVVLSVVLDGGRCGGAFSVLASVGKMTLVGTTTVVIFASGFGEFSFGSEGVYAC